MKKILRIILISLGAVAAIAGFASLSFGMTSLFSKYRDAKTTEVSEPEQSSKTSSSKDSSSGSSSSSGGASSSSEAPISSSEPPSSSSEEPPQPEEVGLFLSKDKIFLDDEEQGAAQDTITATVTGCDSTVSWLVTSSNYITVAESTTNSGEANTVATTGIFENVENIRVSLTDDPIIYKDISVYYLNIPASLNLNTIGVNDSNGNTVSESVNSGYTSPVTYDQDGIYFESNSYMTNNRYGEFFDTVEEAKSAGKSLLVTASQGSTVKVQFKLKPKYKQYLVQWPSPYEDFEFTDYWNWFDEDNSTMEYEELGCYAPSYNSLYWTYRITIKLTDDFNGKTGDFVVNFGGKYFNIHFNAYIPSGGE